ncbi:hypothetical protein [Mycobacteroides abscessus]|uniref:hypothetical protein n=1 Tax=Mycobacteroides abscessus TaxID=36809 RepID=UPI0009432693|nr:hypothetical protein [Mycobacteroides abscessus]
MVIARGDVDRFAQGLRTEHGFWYFQHEMSANGIQMYFAGELADGPDCMAGDTYASLWLPGYSFVNANVTKTLCRDVAAGLTGASSVLVHIPFRATNADTDEDLPDPVPVYFVAEHGYSAPLPPAPPVPAESATKAPRRPVARRTVPSRAARRRTG